MAQLDFNTFGIAARMGIAIGQLALRSGIRWFCLRYVELPSMIRASNEFCGDGAVGKNSRIQDGADGLSPGLG